MPTTTTVTHPDNTVSKRTSKTRTYTHAVVVATSREALVRRAQESSDNYLAQAAEYVHNAETGVYTVESRVSFMDSVRNIAKIGDTYAGCNYDGPAPTEAEARENVMEYADHAQRNSDHYAAQAVKHAAGPEVIYSVVRWSSRLDLAEKAAQGEFASSTPGVTVTVVSVD